MLQVTSFRNKLLLGAHNANKGYPDGHADNSGEEETEIDRLKEKIDSGADFVITQLFYDVDHFLSWYKKVRQRGSLLTFFYSWSISLMATRHHCTSYPRDYADSNVLLFRKSN